MSGTSERWQRVEALCQAALERSASDRPGFVLAACGDDADLQRDVETLLAHDDASSKFLETPIGAVAAHVMLHEPFNGTCVGSFEDPLVGAAGDVNQHRDLEFNDFRFSEGELISGRFLIRRQVGEGGMAVVYDASDTKLDQRCALKCAKLGFSRRLSPEARSALRITHKNICRVYGIYTVETRRGPIDVLAMEYLDGETLCQRLARTGPVGGSEAVEIGRQLCEGLSMAHRAGVLHRDLKSNNVMLTRSVDGWLRVVITDFGIATEDRNDVNGRASAPGDLAGAIAYMAPELLDGRRASVASDVYALGIVLQEMLSGRLPTGDVRPKEQSSVNACTDIARGLAQIVNRCLEKNPDDRFRSADALRVALESLVEAKSPDRAHPAPANSIAVLPFVNMSSHPENDFFCDGLAEEMINALTRMSGLQVAARTSAFRFRSRDLDIREVGRQLHVATVLEGSVRRAGGDLRITVQLINAADGYHLWSARYDCELAGVFQIQDRITASILRTLDPTLLVSQVPLARRHSLDIHAFELYLKGQQLSHQRTPQSLRAAVLSLGEATRIDRRYALAHAGLAASYAIIAAYGSRHSPKRSSPRRTRRRRR